MSATLSDFAREYVSARAISPVYAGTLIRRAIAFGNFAREHCVALVFTEQRLNEFLAFIAPGLSSYTTKSYRSDLLTLWRAAADDGHCGYPVLRKIRRERLDALVVECYTADDVRALVATAAAMRGGLANGVAKRLYWPAMIRAAWDSGLRRGDLWRLSRNSVRPDGTMILAQHKTGRIAFCRLRESTVAALDAIGGASPLAWVHNGWTFGEQFQRLVTNSGVKRGTFRWLRRASGSYVEAQQPGAGHKHLGHATPAVFSQHYDARLGMTALPMPPEL